MLIAALLVACRPDVSIPSDLLRPETVGVVERTTAVNGTTATIDVILLDAGTVRINLDEAEDLYGRQPEAGLLLLYGTQDDAGWYATLEPGGASLPADCFRISDPAVDAGGFVDFPSGIRLAKADAFDDEELARDGTYTSRYGFCVNRNGEVTQYGGT